MTGRILILFSILSICLSCKSDMKDSVVNNLEGQYYTLENDKINLFLPENFNLYTAEEFKKTLNNIKDSTQYKLRKVRLENLHLSYGNAYFLQDSSSSTYITVKMSKYLPFTREDSSKMLGILTLMCQETPNITCKKIKAGYSGNTKTQVFKSVYEISYDSTKVKKNLTSYIISSRPKSFALSIESPEYSNYDKFIEKIQIK